MYRLNGLENKLVSLKLQFFAYAERACKLAIRPKRSKTSQFTMTESARRIAVQPKWPEIRKFFVGRKCQKTCLSAYTAPED